MVDVIPNPTVFRPLWCLREAAEREQSEQKDGPGRFFHTNFGLYWEKKTWFNGLSTEMLSFFPPLPQPIHEGGDEEKRQTDQSKEV